MKIIATVEARMTSTRLPGKVLASLNGEPVLQVLLERVKKATSLDGLVVATTSNAADDAIVDMVNKLGFSVYRGSEEDVLGRVLGAAQENNADVLVQLTGDNPLIDPKLIDEVIDLFKKQNADFAANRLPPPYHRTYPIGLDVEVVSFKALERAWKEAELKFEREHVMPHLYTREGRFNVAILDAESDHGDYRWTVDTPEDLRFVRELVSQMKCGLMLGWKGILDFVEANPELQQINAAIQHKSYKDVDKRSQDKRRSANE